MGEVIMLLGPTASGKTQLAIELVQQFPFEIISVDSAMIYKHMDIGTGKPTKAELALAPHHLIDFLEPTQSYSAADFRNDALKLIGEIHHRNKIPLLVGGTMLYFNALINGLAALPEADLTVRKQLERERQTDGLAKLYAKLMALDPLSAKRIHPNDPQRILRAMEVYQLTGKPMSEFWENSISLTEQYAVTQLAIFPENREALHQAIALRFQKMLDHGFVEEVMALRERGDLDSNLPSMRCVGYRQVWQYLEGAMDYSTMQEKAVAATRQLAKRQLTWLRHWKNLHCFATAEEIRNYFLGI